MKYDVKRDIDTIDHIVICHVNEMKESFLWFIGHHEQDQVHYGFPSIIKL